MAISNNAPLGAGNLPPRANNAVRIQVEAKPTQNKALEGDTFKPKYSMGAIPTPPELLALMAMPGFTPALLTVGIMKAIREALAHGGDIKEILQPIYDKLKEAQEQAQPASLGPAPRRADCLPPRPICPPRPPKPAPPEIMTDALGEGGGGIMQPYHPPRPTHPGTTRAAFEGGNLINDCRPPHVTTKALGESGNGIHFISIKDVKPTRA